MQGKHARRIISHSGRHKLFPNEDINEFPLEFGVRELTWSLMVCNYKHMHKKLWLSPELLPDCLLLFSPCCCWRPNCSHPYLSQKTVGLTSQTWPIHHNFPTTRLIRYNMAPVPRRSKNISPHKVVTISSKSAKSTYLQITSSRSFSCPDQLEPPLQKKP